MTLEEAIRTAIEYETDVKEVYAEAISKTQDAVGQKVFKTLAREEQDHLDYLEAKLKQLKETGTVEAVRLETVVPAVERIQYGVAKLEKRMDGVDHGTELEMLKKALEVEKETGDFYKRMVSELDATGRKFFERFVEIEEGHYAIVQSEIDALQGNGFWFDFMEFNMEAG